MSSHELNFFDGDIILAFPIRTYCVHKTVLSAKSGVFADLFAMANPSNNLDELYDREQTGQVGQKLPAIKMQDEEEAFKLLLHALYDHELDPHIPKLERKTINLISHVFDLVDKYNVSQAPMRAKFIPFINRDWPDALSAWDANEAYIQKLRLDLGENSELLNELDERLPDPAYIIRFAYMYTLSEARTQPIPSYVPTAFYHLSRIPPFADSDDATLNGDDFTDGLRTAKRSLLRHQDMICLMHGLHNLRVDTARVAFVGFLQEAQEDPDAGKDEKSVMVNWWRNVGIEKLVGPHERPDTIATLKNLVELLAGSPSSDPESIVLHQGTNPAYRQRMQTYLIKERETFWADLIKKFSLYGFFY